MVIGHVEASNERYKVGDLMPRHFISQVALSSSLHSRHQPPAPLSGGVWSFGYVWIQGQSQQGLVNTC